MNYRIADTFTDSLAKLSGDEQKAVKTTAFDLQMNPRAVADVTWRVSPLARSLTNTLRRRSCGSIHARNSPLGEIFTWTFCGFLKKSSRGIVRRGVGLISGGAPTPYRDR